MSYNSKFSWKKIKYYIFIGFVILLVVTIGIPGLTYYLGKFNFFGFTKGELLEYAGVLIGGGITLYILYISNKNTNINLKKQFKFQLSEMNIRDIKMNLEKIHLYLIADIKLKQLIYKISVIHPKDSKVEGIKDRPYIARDYLYNKNDLLTLEYNKFVLYSCYVDGISKTAQDNHCYIKDKLKEYSEYINSLIFYINELISIQKSDLYKEITITPGSVMSKNKFTQNYDYYVKYQELKNIFEKFQIYRENVYPDISKKINELIYLLESKIIDL